jgi:hypothetical protein
MASVELINMEPWRENYKVMVFNAHFNNISVIYIVAVSFIGGGNWSTRRKLHACHKSQTKLIVIKQMISNYKYGKHLIINVGY